MNKNENSAGDQEGVFFSKVDEMKHDEHIHRELLQSVTSVADEAGIQMLMKTCGLSREEAIQFVQPKGILPSESRI